MSRTPPPRGRNYPFPQRGSAFWKQCHVTYDQAVDMYYDQTAMQQYLGHDPIVNSLVYKRVKYPTIFDAQRAYTQDQNAFYQEKEQEQLALEARGIKAFKNMNDAIRGRLNPTEDGLANPLERPLKPMGEVSKGVLFSNESMNHIQASDSYPQIASLPKNVESTSLQMEIVNGFRPLVKDILSKSIKDGVYVWIEEKGVGHSFVSVFKNKEPTLYSYGRYGNDGEADGVLLIYRGDAAYSYMKDQLYYKDATVFYMNNVDSDKVGSYFDRKYKEGNNVINTYTKNSEADNRIKTYGKVIDFYELTRNNCTTHSVSSLRFGGAKLNNNTIPSSFKEYLGKDKNTTNVTTVFNFYYSKIYENKSINESIEHMLTGFVVGSSGDEIISLSNWIN